MQDAMREGKILFLFTIMIIEQTPKSTVATVFHSLVSCRTMKLNYLALCLSLTAAQTATAFVHLLHSQHDGGSSSCSRTLTSRFSTAAGVEEQEEISTTAATTPYSKTATVLGDSCEAGGTLLAELQMVQKQNYPIQPQTLVAKAKFALRKDSGVKDPSLWAEDFEFVAPYVGPLSKDEFLQAAEGFQIYEAFPDFDNRYFGFTVDPLEPGRVWFFTRLKATNTGKLFGQEPTGKTVELPPQVYSFKFNEKGLIREMTVGYAVDRRQGDTGGLGGMFGLFYGVGKPLPFPEGKPYKLSKRYRFFQKVGGLITKFTAKKKDE